MIPAGTARRYAAALYALAREHGEQEKTYAELQQSASIIGGYKMLSEFFVSPVISRDEKTALIERSFPVGHLLRHFILLLAERKALGALPGISRRFRKLLDEEQGVCPARIVTPAPLSEAQQKSVRKKLETLIGKPITPDFATDPALIAGFTAEYDTTILDASVRSRLQTMKKFLNQ